MEHYNRKAIFEELNDFCSFADLDAYIEITEWANGEGFDARIHSIERKDFSLTWGEFEALKKLVEGFVLNP